jgi:hypothetical protein
VSTIRAWGTEADPDNLARIAAQAATLAGQLRTLHPRLLSRELGGTVAERAEALDQLALRLAAVGDHVARHYPDSATEQAKVRLRRIHARLTRPDTLEEQVRRPGGAAGK